jgi:hypothetical protein
MIVIKFFDNNPMWSSFKLYDSLMILPESSYEVLSKKEVKFVNLNSCSILKEAIYNFKPSSFL